MRYSRERTFYASKQAAPPKSGLLAITESKQSFAASEPTGHRMQHNNMHLHAPCSKKHTEAKTYTFS